MSEHAQADEKHDRTQDENIEHGEVIEECCHRSILLTNRILQKRQCSKYYFKHMKKAGMSPGLFSIAQMQHANFALQQY